MSDTPIADAYRDGVLPADFAAQLLAQKSEIERLRRIIALSYCIAGISRGPTIHDAAATLREVRSTLDLARPKHGAIFDEDVATMRERLGCPASDKQTQPVSQPPLDRGSEKRT